jgi:hypothetical protein
MTSADAVETTPANRTSLFTELLPLSRNGVDSDPAPTYGRYARVDFRMCG